MEELIEDILKSLNNNSQSTQANGKPSVGIHSSPWGPFMKIIQANINDIDMNELLSKGKYQSKDAQNKSKASQGVEQPDVFTHFFNDMKENFQQGTATNNSFNVDMFKDNEGILHIVADVPGVDKSDVDVNVSSTTSVIEINVKKQNTTDIVKMPGAFLKNERITGKLSRSIVLPTEANMSSIIATYDNGVLHITIATKSTSTDFRKVQIQ